MTWLDLGVSKLPVWLRHAHCFSLHHLSPCYPCHTFSRWCQQMVLDLLVAVWNIYNIGSNGHTLLVLAWRILSSFGRRGPFCFPKLYKFWLILIPGFRCWDYILLLLFNSDVLFHFFKGAVVIWFLLFCSLLSFSLIWLLAVNIIAYRHLNARPCLDFLLRIKPIISFIRKSKRNVFGAD